MAEIELLLQGLSEGDDHESAVNSLLELSNIDNYLFSLAFLRSGGVSRLSTNLTTISGKIEVFIGIRNGVTSVQSVFELFRAGISPYAVDTASSNKIFHPKIYAAYNDTSGHVILGSANLTHSGLNINIEASSVIKLDRSSDFDEKYLSKLIQIITSMPTTYPDHVFKITSPKHAVRLLKEGRLEDERLTRISSIDIVSSNHERDSLPPIPTYVKNRPKLNKGAKRVTNQTNINSAVLVWESKMLTERSLNIPTGYNTNITGDANLGLGSMDGIDFQSYFRSTVFSSLAWNKDPSSRAPHLERAIMNTEIIIKRQSYGRFTLEVTHDPRTDTSSYLQRNVMTKIKWGDARDLIAKRDLLGRTLKLFQVDPVNFLIVIE